MMSMQCPLPSLDWDTSNLVDNWKKFKQHVDLMFAGPLLEITEEQKIAYLLLWIGPKGRDIFNSYTLDENLKKEIKGCYSIFEDYVKPKSNPVFARYKFHTRMQADESFDDFFTDLKLLVHECTYKAEDVDEFVRDRIVCGISNSHVRQKLLSEGGDLTLTKTVNIVRTYEATKKQLKIMDNNSYDNEINKNIHAANHGPSSKPRNSPAYASNQRQQKTKNCNYCGYLHPQRPCPAKGKQCNFCHKYNHFESVCKRKSGAGAAKLYEVTDNHASQEVFYFDSVETNNLKDQAFAELRVEHALIKFKLDTGAQANIIPQSIFKKHFHFKKLQPTNCKFRSYSGDDIPVCGCIYLEFKYGNKATTSLVYITKQNSIPILGLNSCTDLELIKLTYATEKQAANSSVAIVNHFEDLFSGIGLFPGECKLHLKPDSTPVVHAPRRIPFAIQDKFRAELHRLEELEIIKKVTEPTEWVSSLVIVEKPKTGDLRICLDPKELNRAILRPHYPMPTVNDVFARLTNAKFFSVLDAKSGYWNIRLCDDSSYLTTFNTMFGRYRFLRLPFGIVSAQDEYQRKMDEMLEGIDGAVAIVDDILVYGSTIEEHDQHLKAVLEKAQQYGVRFNPDKRVICQKSVRYFGHIISESGIQPDPDKVRAICNLVSPKCRSELETLLGMINYLAKFAPMMSEKTNAMRSLLKKENEFIWDENCEKSLNDIKDMLRSEPVLAHFNPCKQITLQVDASQHALGATLLQEGQPVAYASKSLTKTERNYAQIEKEAYAILFGCQYFHQYIYRAKLPVIIESDHKPLEPIFKKPISCTPARLQRILLPLLRYDLVITHVPGKLIPVADCLSRNVKNTDVENENEFINYAVHQVISNLPVSDNKLEHIRIATASDEHLSSLTNQIKHGWPDSIKECPKSVQKFWNHRDELTIMNGIVFKSDKIVIPLSLRKEMLIKLHTAHLGIEKSKERARDVIFWPGMNQDIENHVKSCETCLSRRNNQPKETLMSHEAADYPWQRVATDLFQWQDNHFIVVVDYYSRFFELEKTNLSSSDIITKMKQIFSRHGIPEQVVSDNGPQYSSHEFEIFAKNYGFVHKTSSPRYPQSNGLAERTVQTAKNILEKSSNGDFFLALLEYRNTPVDNHYSPAQLLMSRRLRSMLPQTAEQLLPIAVNCELQKAKRKQLQHKQSKWYNVSAKYYKELKPGAKVKVRLGAPGGVWSSGTIVRRIDDRSYEVQANNKSYRRNRRYLFPTIKEDEDQAAEDFPNGTYEDPVHETEPVCEPVSGPTRDPPVQDPYVTRSGRIVQEPDRLRYS